MNIVVASDENYIPHLKTLLTSIGEANRKVEKLKIYVFDAGISDESRYNIEQYIYIYTNMEFEFHEMSERVIAEKIGDNVIKDRSLVTFARIFIPEILKDKRALYFDVDAIVLQELSALYQIDLENFAIAGVQDINPITRHRKVGLCDDEAYINAGMILWNLEKCREIHFVDMCRDFVGLYEGKVDAMDQGTINGVLGSKGLIKIIHPKYNVLTSMYQLKRNDIMNIYGLRDYYSNSELEEAVHNPVFVHFTPNMTTRPWEKHCKHPMKSEYWRFRLKNDVKKVELSEDKRGIKLIILGWIYRNLPISVFKALQILKKNMGKI